MLQFLQTTLFTVLSLVLIVEWGATATSIVSAFGVALAVTFAIGWFWMRSTWRSLPMPSATLSHRRLWAVLVPFAFWVWIGNWLTNLVSIVDRYMIIHFGGLPAGEALEQIGQYHSTAVIPLVMVGVAGMLGGVITPHFSHDWEAGRRDEVARQAGLAVKLVGAALAAAGAALLLVAPWLFDVLFAGKYSDGLFVLPLALSYCAWLAMTLVAESYLWVAEKTKLCCAAIFFGLVANVGLNLVLLPLFGLVGAVLATAAANLLALLSIYAFGRVHGLHIDLGTLLVTALPAAFWFGPWVVIALLLTTVLAALISRHVLSEEEKQNWWMSARIFSSVFAWQWDTCREQHACLATTATIQMARFGHRWRTAVLCA